ncbi:solute carrier family 25 member 44-like [Symsagittifera roscoffensis]|uniref:solute carrier family 25 member 44-like n=1 Tax=Symsagittifera roscoffensis TaxID=84072 RepID=UPI00307CAE07
MSNERSNPSSETVATKLDSATVVPSVSKTERKASSNEISDSSISSRRGNLEHNDRTVGKYSPLHNTKQTLLQSKMQPVRLDESACSIPEMTTASDLIGTNPSVGSELKMEGYTPIGFEHMNMRNFAMLSLGNSFIIRTLIYPTTLIKTRLQVEKSGAGYLNGRDAFRKILKSEGVSGLYRGFSVYMASAFSGCCYILTYEYSKHWVRSAGGGRTAQNITAGALASLVGQTISVPVDILSQHMMMTARRDMRVHSIGDVNIPKGTSLFFVARTVYSKYGLCGVYRGYFSSMFLYASNSALWWQFYSIYNDAICSRKPEWMPTILCNCITGPLAGLTSSYLTNPLDVIRARMQVEGQPSAFATMKSLIESEGLIHGMHKGVGARMFNAVITSLIITLTYEVTKRFSLNSENKKNFNW